MTAFPKKPLTGQTVLITQPRPLAETPLVDRLNSVGADVILHPSIEIREPADWGPVDTALSKLHKYGTVAFLGKNSVQYFFGRFRGKAGPAGLSDCQIAAIGPATANRLQEYGEYVDFVPEFATGKSLADRLISAGATDPILVIGSNRDGRVLAQELAAAKLKVEEVAVYESHDVETVHPETYQLVFDGKVDWVTITSSALARATVALFGAALANTKLSSISPTVTRALAREGFEPAVEAGKRSHASLVNSMCRYNGSSTV